MISPSVQAPLVLAGVELLGGVETMGLGGPPPGELVVGFGAGFLFRYGLLRGRDGPLDGEGETIEGLGETEGLGVTEGLGPDLSGLDPPEPGLESSQAMGVCVYPGALMTSGPGFLKAMASMFSGTSQPEPSLALIRVGRDSYPEESETLPPIWTVAHFM